MVRRLALDTLCRLCAHGGAALRPHVPAIVTSLTEALSALEPPALNYLTFHTESMGIAATDVRCRLLLISRHSTDKDRGGALVGARAAGCGAPIAGHASHRSVSGAHAGMGAYVTLARKKALMPNDRGC